MKLNDTAVASVEAMGADAALVESNGFHQVVDGVELESIHLQFLTDGVHHRIILVAAIHRIFVEMLVVAALKVLDHPARNEFKG